MALELRLLLVPKVALDVLLLPPLPHLGLLAPFHIHFYVIDHTKNSNHPPELEFLQDALGVDSQFLFLPALTFSQRLPSSKISVECALHLSACSARFL